jgi:hypothetical protein
MTARTPKKIGLSSIILLLVALPVRAQVVSLSADIGALPADLIAPARIDPSIASETIRTRTLVNLWQQDGDLAAMRRVLADPVKRAHAVGHFAEDDFVANNPAWRKTASPNAPENDVWRWMRGRMEGGQIKTHANGNPADYLRDMFKDAKAENFFVPDDHVQPLLQKIQQQIGRAEAGDNERVAEIWRQQLVRVKPLGRTYAELEGAVTRSAQGTVRACALEGAGGTAAIVLAADGAVICYRCSKGELTPMQVQQAGTEAVARASAVGLATYGVIILGANPVGITVIVVGGVVYVVADYAIDELRPSYTSSPMTTAQIDEVMPIGWRREAP